jgi:hypothetical protein
MSFLQFARWLGEVVVGLRAQGDRHFADRGLGARAERVRAWQFSAYVPHYESAREYKITVAPAAEHHNKMRVRQTTFSVLPIQQQLGVKFHNQLRTIGD